MKFVEQHRETLDASRWPADSPLASRQQADLQKRAATQVGRLRVLALAKQWLRRDRQPIDWRQSGEREANLLPPAEERKQILLPLDCASAVPLQLPSRATESN